MADQHIGYPGSVSAVQLASWIPNVGSARFSVEDVTHARVVTNSIGDRGVTVLPGTVYGDGIMDVFETGTNLNFASASSDRWDMVVLRRTWNPTPGASTSVYTIIQGGPNRSLPARQNSKGSVSDQPIALCRIPAGSAVVTEIIDLRCWADNGGVVAVDILVMSYMNQIGTRLHINGEDWIYRVTYGNGAISSAAWELTSKLDYVQLGAIGAAIDGNVPNNAPFTIQAGSNVATTDNAGFARITFGAAFPNGLLTIILTNGDSSIDRSLGRGTITMSVAGAPWDSGSRTSVVYQVAAPTAMLPNQLHRVNWIAIGW